MQLSRATDWSRPQWSLIAWGIGLLQNCTHSLLGKSEPRHMLDVLAAAALAFGVETMSLSWHLITSMDAPWIVALLSHSSLSPPHVICGRHGSSLLGWQSTAHRTCVTFLLQGTLLLSTNSTTSMPLVLPQPCANLANSLVPACIHHSLMTGLGWLIGSQHAIQHPILSSQMEPALRPQWIGEFQAVACPRGAISLMACRSVSACRRSIAFRCGARSSVPFLEVLIFSVVAVCAESPSLGGCSWQWAILALSNSLCSPS